MDFSIELGLILLFSVIGGVLAIRFKQPSVVGLILIGAIIGPYNLGLIKNTELLRTVTEIGAVLLLFTVGIEFNLDKLIKYSFKAIAISILKIGVMFLLGFYVSFIFGLSTITSIFIGTIVSITSTVIFLKVLEQKGMITRKEVPLLVSLLIIEDIFGIFALTFFSGLNNSSDLEPFKIIFKLVISFLLLFFAYIIIQKILRPIINWLIRYSTEETVTFLSLTLCGLMVYISIKLSLSPTVGAFLAGNIVASLPHSNLFQKAIRPFLLTFTSLFFFSIGSFVHFEAMLQNWILILTLFFIFFIGIFLMIGLGTSLFGGFSGRKAIFSGLSMATMGEFSLLIANESTGLGLGVDLVSITAAIILISAITMSLLISKENEIYSFVAKNVPVIFRKDLAKITFFSNTLSWQVFSDRMRNMKMQQNWQKVKNNLISLLLVLSAGFLFFEYSTEKEIGLLGVEYNPRLSLIFGTILFIFISFSAFKITRYTKALFKDISFFFIRPFPSEKTNEVKILRNIIIISTIFMIMIILPIIIFVLKLNWIYHLIALFLLVVIAILTLKSTNLVDNVISKHPRLFNKRKKSK